MKLRDIVGCWEVEAVYSTHEVRRRRFNTQREAIDYISDMNFPHPMLNNELQKLTLNNLSHSVSVNE